LLYGLVLISIWIFFADDYWTFNYLPFFIHFLFSDEGGSPSKEGSANSVVALPV
jgi:hypothetical protein